MNYKPFDVVLVPFPFIEKEGRKRRPSLVISTQEYNSKTGTVILAMITSKKSKSQFGDIEISDLSVSGLPVPSLVRWKLFTLQLSLISKKIGHISEIDQDSVIRAKKGILS